ncbi:MAG: carbamoyltransferase N-terminal domain-containing protein, partial [Planctomycetota bacterium]
MTRRVLGVNAFRRDPAAAIVLDGVPVAAIQEERLTRKRGEDGFPRRSVRWCLEQAGCTAQELDLVVISEKPLRRFERVLGTQLHGFPRGAGAFASSMFLWLGDRLWMRGRIAAELEIPAGRVRFVEHARAHAASAAASAEDENLAALVLDDVGEWAATTLARVS